MKQSTTMAIVACLGVAPAAIAQTIEYDDSIALNEVTIVAQQANYKTPIAFTNLSAKQIEHANTGRDIPYLLTLTPSVVVTSDAGAGVGYSSIRIRGTEGSRINVTANGIPINDSESHNVYWVNLPDMASSIQSLQVQRGVGTSANGAGAFGASINMVTDSPSTEPFGIFSASYGSYNTHKETLKLNTGLLGGHWVLQARLSNIGSDGYIDRASTDLYSYLGQIGYYTADASVRFIAFGGKERTYMAWDYASKEDMEKYGRRYNPCGQYTDADGKTAYYPDQYDNYTTHNFQLLFKKTLSSSVSIDAALHFTKGDGYYEQYKTRRTLIEYGLQPFKVPVVSETGETGYETVKKSDLVRLKNMDNEFGGGVFNLYYHSGRLNLIAGAAANGYHGLHFGQISWVRNYVGDINPLQEYYRNTGRKIDANAFVRANCAVNDKFSAYADLQFRHIHYTIKGISDTYDYNISAPQPLNIHARYNFLNPKLGLIFIISDGNRLFASWSTAHKEPTRDNFVDADPDRLPTSERLFDYEIGYEYSSRTFSAAANLYYMQYKDQLVATGQLSDTGNAISVNVPDSYRAGIELQMAYRPASWFEWSANATISNNRIKDFVEYVYEDEWTNPITINHGDTRIAFSPDFIFNNNFAFEYKGFDASLQTHYVSRQYLSNAQIKEQSLNAYIVSNLSLGYTFSTRSIKRMRVGFTIYNLFNEKYENNGYAGAGYYVDNGEKVIYRYAGFAAQAPINVMGSVNITF